MKPKRSKICSAGADMPNRSMAMMAPCPPTQRSQPSETPASTLTRAPTSGGRTSSRYAAGWAANRSQQGIETTRVRMPSAVSTSRAAMARCSSEPVAMRMSSGPVTVPIGRRGLGQHVGSCAHAAAGVLGGPGQDGQLLAGQREGRGSGRCSTARAQAAEASFASPGRTKVRFGMARSAA